MRHQKQHVNHSCSKNPDTVCHGERYRESKDGSSTDEFSLLWLLVHCVRVLVSGSCSDEGDPSGAISTRLAAETDHSCEVWSDCSPRRSPSPRWLTRWLLATTAHLVVQRRTQVLFTWPSLDLSSLLQVAALLLAVAKLPSHSGAAAVCKAAAVTARGCCCLLRSGFLGLRAYPEAGPDGAAAEPAQQSPDCRGLVVLAFSELPVQQKLGMIAADQQVGVTSWEVLER